ncbi:uncharacterized protein [Dysidea avara]|uniref:uncharacterized protein n=1 Tax=Dysidea avara TaxID=196820 RepID=UPI00331C860E
MSAVVKAAVLLCLLWQSLLTRLCRQYQKHYPLGEDTLYVMVMTLRKENITLSHNRSLTGMEKCSDVQSVMKRLEMEAIRKTMHFLMQVVPMI